MSNTLVIVESPSKIQTIKGALGKGYKIMASKGHVRDLPKSKLGIDIENDFEPKYINIRGKSELINSLKKEAKKADRVLLAADPDREGEAISWHLAVALGLDSEKAKRICFNDLTKNSLKEAIKHPRDIDMNLVDSQQTRRILDRLVGYKISPFLWKKIKSGLSAGRVQSVVTRMIVEREDEIEAFVPVEYWSITADMKTGDGERFSSRFHGDKNGKIELENKEQTDKILENIKNAQFKVDTIKKSLKTRRPAPPFTTSTLQQDANRRLNFQSQRTMMLAQELYEGVNIGEKGMYGLITYMRTDSVRVAEEAQNSARKFIDEKYGSRYFPAKPNVYKTKKNAQDAHEAIRPSDPSITPEMIREKLTNDQYRLYKLIWERFVASQMRSAEFDTVTVDIAAGDYIFRSNGRTVKFIGFLAVYGDMTEEGDDEKDGEKLPELKENDIVYNEKITPVQHFTQPPPRYTEGSLVKVLEEKGIGRPSTYTASITTILARGYVNREGKSLVPTELGRITTNLMIDQFPDIVNYNFTAQMEEELDKVENGEADYIQVLNNFYSGFEKELEQADKNIDKIMYKKPVEETDLTCDKCGSKMIVKESRYGKFAACPNYPECKSTKKLNQETGGEETGDEVLTEEICPKCGKQMVLKKGMYGSFYACRDYPDCKTTKPFFKDLGVPCPKCGKKLITKTSRNKRVFYSCEGYPECNFSVWDIPTEEKCPACGSMMLKKKNKELLYCSNKECGANNG